MVLSRVLKVLSFSARSFGLAGAVLSVAALFA